MGRTRHITPLEPPRPYDLKICLAVVFARAINPRPAKEVNTTFRITKSSPDLAPSHTIPPISDFYRPLTSSGASLLVCVADKPLPYVCPCYILAPDTLALSLGAGISSSQYLERATQARPICLSAAYSRLRLSRSRFSVYSFSASHAISHAGPQNPRSCALRLFASVSIFASYCQ